MDTPTADSKVLFCEADVATALGYSNSRKALVDPCKAKETVSCFTTGSLRQQISTE